MKNLLLIDISGLGYAAMYQPALAHLKHNGESTSAINGAIGSVISMMKRYPIFTPIVLWDGRAQWRYDLVPGYKSNRADDEVKIAIRESFAKQVTPIKRILHEAGIPQLHHQEVEADDLAGMICRAMGGKQDVDVVMGSKDTDWWQGLHHNIQWYSNLTNTVFSLEDLKSTNVTDGPFASTQQFVQAKALAGDTSDTIPGIPGIGLKTAAKMLQEYGSIEALWDKFDAGEITKGQRLINVAGKEYRDLYRKNLRMVDWSAGEPVDMSLLKSTYKTADHNAMQSIGMTFDFKTLGAVVSAAGTLPDYSEDIKYVLDAINQNTSIYAKKPVAKRIFKF